MSCSGIHPEAITHFIPKSVKSTSQHLGSTPCMPCLKYHQQSKEKDWSVLGATWVKCSGIHPEPWTQCTPKTDKLTQVNTTNAMPKTKSAKKKYRLLLCLTNLTIQYWISVHSRIFYLWWREMERQAWSMEVPVNLALMIRWGLNNSNVTSLVDRWHEMKKTQ